MDILRISLRHITIQDYVSSYLGVTSCNNDVSLNYTYNYDVARIKMKSVTDHQ